MQFDFDFDNLSAEDKALLDRMAELYKLQPAMFKNRDDGLGEAIKGYLVHLVKQQSAPQKPPGMGYMDTAKHFGLDPASNKSREDARAVRVQDLVSRNFPASSIFPVSRLAQELEHTAPTTAAPQENMLYPQRPTYTRAGADNTSLPTGVYEHGRGNYSDSMYEAAPSDPLSRIQQRQHRELAPRDAPLLQRPGKEVTVYNRLAGLPAEMRLGLVPDEILADYATWEQFERANPLPTRQAPKQALHQQKPLYQQVRDTLAMYGA